MSEFPSVSVIITTFNRADMLCRAVGSVLSQTYADYELIIVDDGSSDHTPDVLASFRGQVTLVRHETSMGPSASRNSGIDKAQGEYVAFLDDDDEWLSTKLQEQVAVLDNSNPNVALVYCWFDREDDQTGQVGPGLRSTMCGDVKDELLGFNMPAPTSTYLVRTQVAREVRFDESLWIATDLDFFIRLACQWEVGVVPKALMVLHENHGRRSADVSDRLTRQMDYLNRHLIRFRAELGSRPHALSRIMRHSAMLEAQSGNTITALSNYIRAFSLDPAGTLKVTFLRTRIIAEIAREWSMHKMNSRK